MTTRERLREWGEQLMGAGFLCLAGGVVGLVAILVTGAPLARMLTVALSFCAVVFLASAVILAAVHVRLDEKEKEKDQ